VAVFAVLGAGDVAASLPNPFFALAGLSALLCVVLALAHCEIPHGRSLGYWDEASWFMLIACLG
jgi:hypothetical protein